MNKTLLMGFALCASTLFLSCVQEFDVESNNAENNLENIKLSNAFTTTIPYSVPVVPGYITTVSYKGLMLARTSTPMSIEIPKSAAAARGGGVDVTYAAGETISTTSLWQTVMFEDSKDGDYDYNDIIVHVNYLTEGNKLTVNVQPIALGSSKNIRLGFSWSKGDKKGEEIVADNCRQVLFAGRTGFVNTVKYDEHYNDFKVSKVVENIGSSSTEPLKIAWFIDVEHTGRLYTANTMSLKSIDNDGQPYGFALTDPGVNSCSRLEYEPSTATVQSWNSLIYTPENFEYAQNVTMPIVPDITSTALNMSEYNYIDKSKNAGKTFVVNDKRKYQSILQSDDLIIFVKDGTLDISDISGSGKTTIYVLSNGKLEIGGTNTKQNLTIVNNGGEIEFADNAKLVFGIGTKFYSDRVVDVQNTSIVVEGNAEMYILGDVTVKDLTSRNGAEIFVKSLMIDGNLYLTNKGKLFVNDGLDIESLTMDTEGKLYVGCKLNIAERLTLSNPKAEIFTKIGLKAKNFTWSNGEIYMMGQGLVNISEKLSASNVSSQYYDTGNYIEVIGEKQSGIEGEGMGVVATNELAVQGGTDFARTFKGNIGVAYNLLTGVDEYNYNLINWGMAKYNDNGSKDKDDTVVAPPMGSCSEGFSSSTTDDTGIGWFSFPLETVNITTCYNYETWNSSNPDYRLKSGARVFDINACNPIVGDKLPIFKMKK